MKKIMAILFIPLFFVACDRKIDDLKSPCVGIEKSPCEKRVPEKQPFHS